MGSRLHILHSFNLRSWLLKVKDPCSTLHPVNCLSWTLYLYNLHLTFSGLSAIWATPHFPTNLTVGVNFELMELVAKVNAYGFNLLALWLIHHYLPQRNRAWESINNIVNGFAVMFGVPWGSILGPLLFIIYQKKKNFLLRM